MSPCLFIHGQILLSLNTRTCHVRFPFCSISVYTFFLVVLESLSNILSGQQINGGCLQNSHWEEVRCQQCLGVAVFCKVLYCTSENCRQLHHCKVCKHEPIHYVQATTLWLVGLTIVPCFGQVWVSKQCCVRSWCCHSAWHSEPCMKIGVLVMAGGSVLQGLIQTHLNSPHRNALWSNHRSS